MKFDKFLHREYKVKRKMLRMKPPGIPILKNMMEKNSLKRKSKDRKRLKRGCSFSTQVKETSELND